MKWKHSLLAVAAAAALGAPAPARADNAGTALKIIGAVLTIASGGAASPLFYWGAGLTFAGGIVEGSEQRRKIRKAEAARRQKAIDNLQARNVTLLTAEPPMRGGYGRSLGGGDVIAVFTTDKTVTNEFGLTVVKPDALKHIVIHYLSRQAEALHEVYIDNTPVGALDGSGYPTGGEFHGTPDAVRTIVIPSGTSYTLATSERPATEIVGAPFYTTGSGQDTQNNATTATIAGDGLSISVPANGAGADVTVTYKYLGLVRPVRISKFLGSPTQAVDAYLNGLISDKWTANHRARGLAGIVITLDLEDQRFQGGLPNITVEGSWAKVYDPRLDSTQPGGSGAHRYTDPATWAWSANPALCTADWLCSELGYKCNPASDIDWAYVIAAANICDATGTFDEGAGPFTAARYTCHGVFSADEGKEKVLEDLTESMAGAAIPAAQWQVMAGGWTTPVDTLDDDDLNGSIEVAQADTATDALINSARGRYIPSGKSQPAEANPPYTNATFVTADQGVPLWDDFQFPWTNSNARVRDLLRIKVEQRRSGLVINYPAKLSKWGLRVGERVYVTHTPYAWVNKAFRITDRRHTQQVPVLLTLQEDDPTIWDQADAATADPTPNTGLPSPYNVVALANLTATSNEAGMLLTADGAWVPAVDLTWDAITDRSSIPDGRVEIFWHRNTEFIWRQLPAVSADNTAARISGGVLRAGDRVLIKARVRNRFNHLGPERFAFVVVAGKTSAATTPAGLSATAQPGGVLVAVTPVTASWIKETEFRVGAVSWAASTVLYTGRAASFVWQWPAAGTYTVRAKHRDTSGNESAEATTSITVGTNALVTVVLSDMVTSDTQLFSIGALGVLLKQVNANLNYTNNTGKTVSIEATWSSAHQVIVSGAGGSMSVDGAYLQYSINGTLAGYSDPVGFDVPAIAGGESAIWRTSSAYTFTLAPGDVLQAYTVVRFQGTVGMSGSLVTSNAALRITVIQG